MAAGDVGGWSVCVLGGFATELSEEGNCWGAMCTWKERRIKVCVRGKARVDVEFVEEDDGFQLCWRNSSREPCDQTTLGGQVQTRKSTNNTHLTTSKIKEKDFIITCYRRIRVKRPPTCLLLNNGIPSIIHPSTHPTHRHAIHPNKAVPACPDTRSPQETARTAPPPHPTRLHTFFLSQFSLSGINKWK